MAKTRLELQSFLESFIGSRNVYYQPPESIQMNYPAVVYELNNIGNTSADNSVYLQNISYQITVIDEDPDSEIAKKFSLIPLCRFDRFFTADNLNHFIYTLYY